MDIAILGDNKYIETFFEQDETQIKIFIRPTAELLELIKYLEYIRNREEESK